MFWLLRIIHIVVNSLLIANNVIIIWVTEPRLRAVNTSQTAITRFLITYSQWDESERWDSHTDSQNESESSIGQTPRIRSADYWQNIVTYQLQVRRMITQYTSSATASHFTSFFFSRDWLQFHTHQRQSDNVTVVTARQQNNGPDIREGQEGQSHRRASVTESYLLQPTMRIVHFTAHAYIGHWCFSLPLIRHYARGH